MKATTPQIFLFRGRRLRFRSVLIIHILHRALAVVLALAFTARAAVGERSVEPAPRTSPGGYVKYWPGELPVVISAPHGGKRKPRDMPDRTYGVKTLDGYSAELATAMRGAMRERFGKAPHLIICELARTKVDCNREIVEGAQGCAKSEQTWREYHKLIDEAEKAVLAKQQHGLYLDVHSHGHPKKRIEIGYLLTNADMQLTDAQLDADPRIPLRSSIRLLDELSPARFSELLRGPTSLGGLLESRGIPAVPSPNASPELTDPYFNGGYSVAAHGSRNEAQLDGVQIETPIQLRDTPERRAATARVIAESLDVYFEKHFGMKLSSTAKAPQYLSAHPRSNPATSVQLQLPRVAESR